MERMIMFDRFRRIRPGLPVAEEPQPNEGRTSPMCDELIALSVLELELPAQAGVSLDLAGVTVLEDDIGRRAVGRVDARRLLAEYRERTAREAERVRLHRERTEREAEEADQR